MRPVTFVLGLLLVACASPRDKPALWHGDTRFTEAERAAIVEGEAWIASSAGHEPGGVAFDYSPANATPVAWTIRRERGPYGEHGATGLCLGGAVYVDVDGEQVTNEPPIDLRFLPGLVAHEMAHCRYGFVDGYRAEDTKTDGIMRNLSPMRWTEREEEQCERTRCRDANR